MSKEKIRLDKWLVSANLVTSRERARALILEGRVEVAGRIIDKPGTGIHPGERVVLIEPDHPYVSRGGVKLEGAIKDLGINPEGKVALDVGASTGGFTHCLLLHGAKEVYAVDVGYGQFAWSLRQHEKVKLFERTNIRYFSPEKVSRAIDLAVVDVSFISLKTVIPLLPPFLASEAEVLCLIKPQFEVGKGNVGKGGVVRDPVLIQEVVDDIEGFARLKGFDVPGIAASVIKGPKGNQEFFIYLRRRNEHENPRPDGQSSSGTDRD